MTKQERAKKIAAVEAEIAELKRKLEKSKAERNVGRQTVAELEAEVDSLAKQLKAAKDRLRRKLGTVAAGGVDPARANYDRLEFQLRNKRASLATAKSRAKRIGGK